METDDLLIKLLLYVFLPLWGIAGFIDWLCHRATHIEKTSGIKESIMHSLMGIQIAIPILLCLLFEVNILVLIICLIVLIFHEAVAHSDVRYASPIRKISIWEMHAHNYLATLPLYMLSIIFILNWNVVIQLVTLNWGNGLKLVPLEQAQGGNNYLFGYLSFMTVLCVLPYLEEFIRCVCQFFKNEESISK